MQNEIIFYIYYVWLKGEENKPTLNKFPYYKNYTLLYKDQYDDMLLIETNSFVHHVLI